MELYDAIFYRKTIKSYSNKVIKKNITRRNKKNMWQYNLSK